MDFFIRFNLTPTTHQWAPTHFQAFNTEVFKNNQNGDSVGFITRYFVYKTFCQENENYLVWRIILFVDVLRWDVFFLLEGAKHLIYATTSLKLFFFYKCEVPFTKLTFANFQMRTLSD